MFRAPGLLLALSVLLLPGCGSSGDGGQATPGPLARNEPPWIALDAPQVAHEGFEMSVSLRVHDDDSGHWRARLDWGDGSPMRTLALTRDASATALVHRYWRDGNHHLTVTASDSDGAWSVASATIFVAPRRLLVIHGLGSRSSCTAGSGGGPTAWLGPVLEEFATRLLPEITPRDYFSYSYSGRHCGGDGTNGELADYHRDEACGSIDGPGGAAARLREQIERVSPSRVTIFAHSMGGLVAAYLVGSDPAWARRHVASVLTFDSPLQGVPQLNMAALRIGGPCPFNSGALGDLSDGNERLLEVAGRAAEAVPFYNLDAIEREGWMIGVRQAVPSERTHLEGESGHWQVAARHDEIWDADPLLRDEDAIGQAVVCAIAAATAAECEG